MQNKIISSGRDKMDLFTESIMSEVKAVINNQDIIAKTQTAIAKSDLWAVANLLGNYYNTKEATSMEVTSCKHIITQIREFMGEQAKTSTEPTTVVFGTSGWRGIIGKDFTVLNVHKVTRSIIDMMHSKEFLDTNGYSSFKEVQEKGIVVFRDNRFMGDEFMDAAMKELANAGIKIYFAGECPTGVGSAVVVQLGAAGSINMTPSHNPMDYAGLKFNPADGGPADKDLTDLIMKESEKYMIDDADFLKTEVSYVDYKNNVDAAALYVNFLEEMTASGKGLFNLNQIREFLRSKQDELYIIVDNMHGSSRGYIQKILGEELVAELVSSGAMKFVNTNEDFSFHGVKPEPNPNNQKVIIDMAKAKQTEQPNRRMTLVVALDPDADRIRFGTAQKDIPMNQFGPIAYGHLLSAAYTGPVATTLPSSKFSVSIANGNNQGNDQVGVGFKFFRPLKDALVKYEESDGISFRGHTLEKDGIAGFLMAVQIMMTQNKDIAEFHKELQDEYGFYYASQSPKEVKDISIPDWKKLRVDVEKLLQNQYKDAQSFKIGNETKKVVATNTADGIMLVFDDNSWLLVRSSGTEPKFRVYYEVTNKTELSPTETAERQKAYAEAGLGILNNALATFGR
jgi:phosphomannomutase